MRIVVRKTNRYILGQGIKSKGAQDFVITSANSRELLDCGWPKNSEGSLKSISAAYLTGILLGKKVSDKGVSEAIFDIGLQRNVKGSRLYAFLKGIIDAGIKINTKGEIFPKENRISGEHLKNKINFKEIKSKLEKKFA